MIVLDASALLAFMFRETGYRRVQTVLDHCCMSTVNLSEVLTRFARDGHDPVRVLKTLRASAIHWIPFSETQAAVTAALVGPTRDAGLSLGDRACLALGRLKEIPVMTADRAWVNVDVGVQVDIIRD